MYPATQSTFLHFCTKELCRDISASPRVTVKNIQILMGCLISSKPAVPLTKARSRGIQEMVLKDYKGTVASAKKQVCLTSWAREEVNWWLNLTIEDFHMSLRIVPV